MESKIDIAYAEQMLDKDSQSAVSYCNEHIRLISDAPVSEVQLSYTTSNYADIINLKLLYGEYFKSEDILSKKNNAVISQALAFKLYLNDNACGKYIDINGENFLIVGVYGENYPYLQNISKPKETTIYTSKKINTLTYTPLKYTVSANDNMYIMLQKQNLLDSLKTDMTLKPYNYQILRQSGYINTRLSVAMIVAFSLFKTCYKKLFMLYIVKDLSLRKYLWMAIKSIFCFAVALLFLSFILNFINLPVEILP